MIWMAGAPYRLSRCCCAEEDVVPVGGSLPDPGEYSPGDGTHGDPDPGEILVRVSGGPNLMTRAQAVALAERIARLLRTDEAGAPHGCPSCRPDQWEGSD